MIETRNYRVVSPVLHGRRTYQPGEIMENVPLAIAAPLLALGRLQDLKAGESPDATSLPASLQAMIDQAKLDREDAAADLDAAEKARADAQALADKAAEDRAEAQKLRDAAADDAFKASTDRDLAEKALADAQALADKTATKTADKAAAKK